MNKWFSLVDSGNIVDDIILVLFVVVVLLMFLGVI